MRIIRIFFSTCGLLLIFCLQFKQSNAQLTDKNEFAGRRQKFMEKMNGGIAVFKGNEFVARNNDVDYEFRQESDFYYLTGFDKPKSAFLLIPGSEKEFIMFVREKNPFKEMWSGKIHGIEEAMNIFGADTAYCIEQFEEMLPEFLMGKEKVYYNMKDEEINDKILSIMKIPWGDSPKKVNDPPKQLIDPLPLVNEMRLIKSDYEIAMLRRAIDVTCDAHIEAMKSTAPEMFEYEIGAIIEYIYRKNGCPRVAFPSIVASGPNSIILHHIDNNRQTQNGDVLLIDIGAEYGYYAADITRTIPVNGQFSQSQKEIYEIVLAAQQAGIEMIAPGVSFKKVEDKVSKVLREGLCRLELITDKESEWQYRAWYMHRASHWLGLDVHDAGSYFNLDKTTSRNLKPGMVLTVEPGIYIGANGLDKDKLFQIFKYFDQDIREEDITHFINAVKPAAEKYMNIGIRIEDDILVTNDGHEVLSEKAPKEIKAIESMMQKESIFNQ
jgi:Xaa-Pro aminopeptidase